MPQPCVVSTASVNLTANGAPAVLQADVRISNAPNRLEFNADGLVVRPFDRARLSAAASQSIPNSTSTAVTLGTVDYDSNGLVQGNTIVVKEAGLYVISAAVLFDTSNAGERWVRITKNGAFCGIDYVGGPNPVPGSSTIIPICGQDQLVAGDTIGLQAFQSSGGALNLTFGSRLSNLAIGQVSE